MTMALGIVKASSSCGKCSGCVDVPLLSDGLGDIRIKSPTRGFPGSSYLVSPQALILPHPDPSDCVSTLASIRVGLGTGTVPL